MGGCNSTNTTAKVEFVTPIPCWVIKTKTVESNAKIFLNVVKHDQIPKSSDPMEPRIFIGHEKVESDLKGVECATIDILVHTSVTEGMESGEHPKALKLNRDIINLMNAIGRKKDEDQLRITFSVPKILKCYKGDAVSPVNVTALQAAMREAPDAVASDGDTSSSTDVTTTDANSGALGNTSLPAGDKKFRGSITLVANPGGLPNIPLPPPPPQEDSSSTTNKKPFAEVPAERGDMFRKRGHWMPTMRMRYVHVKEGIIGWYTDASLTDCKGKLSLANCVVSTDESDINSEYQIYVKNRDASKSKEDLLLEVAQDNMEQVSSYRKGWVDSINEHIKYADVAGVEVANTLPLQ